jgi:hypothetical protein
MTLPRWTLSTKSCRPAEYQRFQPQKESDGQIAPVPGWVGSIMPVESFSWH